MKWARKAYKFAVVAQLVRALPCHGRGWRFKSARSRKNYSPPLRGAPIYIGAGWMHFRKICYTVLTCLIHF